jgi:hypothetical protein
MRFMRKCRSYGPPLLNSLEPSIAVDAHLPLCMGERVNEKSDHDDLASFSCLSVHDRCASFSVLPMPRPQAAGFGCGTRRTVLARDV